MYYANVLAPEGPCEIKWCHRRPPSEVVTLGSYRRAIMGLGGGPNCVLRSETEHCTTQIVAPYKRPNCEWCKRALLASFSNWKVYLYVHGWCMQVLCSTAGNFCVPLCLRATRKIASRYCKAFVSYLLFPLQVRRQRGYGTGPCLCDAT